MKEGVMAGLERLGVGWDNGLRLQEMNGSSELVPSLGNTRSMLTRSYEPCQGCCRRQRQNGAHDAVLEPHRPLGSHG